MLNLQFKRITLKHANLNKDVHIILGTIAAYHRSDTSNSTHVYTTAGIFPAIETEEQINDKINALVALETKGGTNQ